MSDTTLRWLGGILMAAGLLLFLTALRDSLHLQWAERPEATNRLLWLEMPGRMLAQTAGFAGGLLLAMVGYAVYPTPHD